MGRNWELTMVFSCLFSQSILFPRNLFILTSSENTVHQTARENQQGRFTASFYLLSSASCFFFGCAFSRGQNSYQKNQGKLLCFSFSITGNRCLQLSECTFGSFKSTWNFLFYPIVIRKFTPWWSMAFA